MKPFFTFLCALLPLLAGAQRTYPLIQHEGDLKMDGYLDSVLLHLPIADSFTTTLPAFGHVPAHPTFVRLCRTEYGIYIFASCRTDAIRDDWSDRDDVAQADYFSVAFDTWNDDQNALIFTATAGGQRIDQRMNSTSNGLGYDAPWQLRTRRLGDRWLAEMHIPYAALRYPTGEQTNWGLQFTRFDRATGETSTWAPQDPLVADVVLQYGSLTQVIMPKHGLRLGVAGQVDHQYKYDETRTSTIFGPFSDSTSSIIGIDLRAGLNSATTLDVSLLPDRIMSENFAFPLTSTRLPQWPLLTNRPVHYEDPGLFNKAGTQQILPTLTELMYDRFSTPPMFFFSTSALPAYNRIQLATRTKEGYGIGVNNQMFALENGYGIFDDIYYGFRDGRINHNQIYVDIPMRNNAWMHFSNNHFSLHNVRSSNLASAAVQLRDGSNTRELAATARLQSQGAFSVGEFDLSLRRVNCANTYGMDYSSPLKTTTGPLFVNGLYDIVPMGVHRVGAFWGKRDFSPRSERFLNNSRFFYLDLYGPNGKAWEQRAVLRGVATATDRRLRQYEAAVGIRPLGYLEPIPDPIAPIYNRVPFALEHRLKVSSDSRRRGVASAMYENRLLFTQQRSVHRLSLEAQYYEGQWLRLESRMSMGFANKILSPSDERLNGRYMEQSNRTNIDVGLSVGFFLGRYLNVRYTLTHTYEQRTNRRLLEITQNGQANFLEHAFWQERPNRYLIQHRGEANLYFTRVSMFRLVIYSGNGLDYTKIRTEADRALNLERSGASISILFNLNAF